jgi:hypothetical protein
MAIQFKTIKRGQPGAALGRWGHVGTVCAPRSGGAFIAVCDSARSARIIRRLISCA